MKKIKYFAGMGSMDNNRDRKINQLKQKCRRQKGRKNNAENVHIDRQGSAGK